MVEIIQDYYKNGHLNQNIHRTRGSVEQKNSISVTVFIIRKNVINLVAEQLFPNKGIKMIFFINIIRMIFLKKNRE